MHLTAARQVHVAAEGADPWQLLARLARLLELGQLGVQVVEEVQGQCLGGHRLHRRGELEASLVREDEVLEVDARADAEGRVLARPDPERLRRDLARLRASGIRSGWFLGPLRGCCRKTI